MNHPPHVVIAYSHAERADLRALTQELDALVALRRITYWAEDALRMADEVDDRFYDEVRRADVVVGLVTTAWLNSAYVRTPLLDAVASGEQQFVAALLEPCPWRRVAWLSEPEVPFVSAPPLHGSGGVRPVGWRALVDAVAVAADHTATVRGTTLPLRATWQQPTAPPSCPRRALRALLASRDPGIRVEALAVDVTAPGRGVWRAEVEVGPRAFALESQLRLLERMADAVGDRLSVESSPMLTRTRFVETGEVVFALGDDGAVDPASLRLRSHLFEDLASMVAVPTPVGVANGKRVTLPHYSLGRFQTTSAMYCLVTGESPSCFADDPWQPVECVSWYDAVRFCNALSRLVGRRSAYAVGDETEPSVAPVEGADGFRLPTEQEWEVACRAGRTRAIPRGVAPASADGHAWHFGNADGSTHPVGQKSANPWGLYDMAGNVWEWCSEPSGAPLRDRPLRGGSWLDDPTALRPAVRRRRHPNTRECDAGFRVAAAMRSHW